MVLSITTAVIAYIVNKPASEGAKKQGELLQYNEMDLAADEAYAEWVQEIMFWELTLAMKA